MKLFNPGAAKFDFTSLCMSDVEDVCALGTNVLLPKLVRICI